MTFFDLFAGAGGFSLGFEMAGAECSLMLERDLWAFNTYRQNRLSSKTLMLNDDIKSIDVVDLKKQLGTSPDIIIGGPPCQGFSNATGKNINDPRNELFREFCKWVKTFHPDFFVIENVLGLKSKTTSEGNLYEKVIIQEFESLGYTIDTWTLNAMNYGVPQQRIRVFFVGNKLGKKIAPPPVTHSSTDAGCLPFVKVWEAIGDLPELKASEGNEIAAYTTTPNSDYQKWARGNSINLYNHVAMKHTKRMIERYKCIQQGQELEDMPEEYKVRRRGDASTLSPVKFGLNYRVLTGDKVSYTIPASFYSSFIHPRQPRNITTREAARLQSFPDDYNFYGKRTLISNSMLKQKGEEVHLSQYNQVGNAVPPLLARAIAKHLMQYI